MNFHVMTLFPDMINDAMNVSITGRAVKKGLIAVNSVNIRDFSKDKHRRVDDYPYGGGAGMLMQTQPVYDCYLSIIDSINKRRAVSKAENQETDEINISDKWSTEKIRTVYMTPTGKIFNQKIAADLSKEDDLIILCGHYEGIDQRVIDKIVTDNISIGDYVLTGGELPALVVMDTVSRLVPGVLNNSVSAYTESHGSDGLLEYPQYTRPEEWMGEKVPEVLLSGDHARQARWYRMQSVIRTARLRPDMIESAKLSPDEKALAEKIINSENK